MSCVCFAEFAILLELKAISRVASVLTGTIIALFALGAS